MRLVPALLVSALLIPTLAACNDDDGVSASAKVNASISPEDARTSAATVARGLAEIAAISSSIALTVGVDKAKAEASIAQIEPIWMTIEGTVKANDSEAYLSFEDNFAGLEKATEDGDREKAGSASAAVSAAVKAYLVAFPG